MCVQLCVRMQGPLKQKDGITTKCNTNYRKLNELSWKLAKYLLTQSESILIPLIQKN